MKVIGIIAGICTTSAVLPQLSKAIRTKQVKDVSIRMFVVLVTGFVLWIIYGISRNDLPIILTNGLSLVLNGLMIILILKFGKKRNISGSGKTQ